MLIYKIQQLSKGSSKGYGIIPEVPDEPKDNSGSSSSSLSGSDDEVQDVSSDEENNVDEKKADAEIAEKQAGNEQPIQNWRDLLRDNPIVILDVLRTSEWYIKVFTMTIEFPTTANIKQALWYYRWWQQLVQDESDL
ncbi:hypothetical protein Tco_0674857 [Tanacetum coccineum]